MKKSARWSLAAAVPVVVVAAGIVVPAVSGDMEFDVTADCLDRGGDVVATAVVRWRLGTAR